MIVVTGAGGHVGGLVARILTERGEQVRLLTRDTAKLAPLEGAEVVRVDGFESPSQLRSALRTGDRVFMVAMHSSVSERERQHRTFVDAATAAGVAQIVYLSCLNAGPNAIFLHGRSHGATERMVLESGIPGTIVRMSMWTEHIPSWFDAAGAIRGPRGDGRISFTYRPEIASVIAAALTESGHQGQTYDVTGPRGIDMAELAAIAADVTGDPYVNDPLDRAAWKQMRIDQGIPQWSVDTGASFWDALHAGEFDVVSDDLTTLTGIQPIGVREWMSAHADELPLSPAS